MMQVPRRPEGWVAPGPRPRAPADVGPEADEDHVLLCGDFRLFQKRRGHRWSLDDLVTAFFAREAVSHTTPRSALDLGCGIGSVATMIAWSFGDTRVTGIEAQEVSVALARRSALWNGIDDRMTLVHGDLRDATTLAHDARFDLVTGTPPYFLRGEAIESSQVQCAPCRFEHRGGPEDYCLAAARWMRPGARFVMCASVLQRNRIVEGARAAGLTVLRMTDVIPREGKDALIVVATMSPDEAVAPAQHDVLVVRDPAHQWTDAFRAVRRALGMPDRAPSRT